MADLKKLKKKLNMRQQRFAEAYAKSGNGTQSAIHAGYSEKGARAMASRQLTNRNVAAYIEGLRDEMMDETILSGREVLYRLSQIALGQIKEEQAVVTKRAEYVENPNNAKMVLVYNESVEKVKNPPKISDQNKALELLGKHHKLFTDKQELDVGGAIQFVDDIDD